MVSPWGFRELLWEYFFTLINKKITYGQVYTNLELFKYLPHFKKDILPYPLLPISLNPLEK
jgi:hypothetical protein